MKVIDDLKMILRHASVNCITDAKTYTEQKARYNDVVAYVYALEQNELSTKWIPFALRECDEEEKEAFNSDYMLSCELPDEDEEIFVTYRFKDEFYVGTDTFMRDGSECYLDSGKEFVTEAIAWKPLPEPYKGE